MRTQLAKEAADFHGVVYSAIERAGGFALLQAAEADPTTRVQVGELLGGIGLWDLRPREEAIELEAAAAACRAAGAFGLPYPVAERLASDYAQGTGALAVVGRRPRVNMADLPLNWVVGDLHGLQASVQRAGDRLDTKLGAFVCPVEVGQWYAAAGADLSLVLQSWTLLGMVGRAAEMTYAHVRDRQQFGKPLASFQAIQFRLTDVAVAVQSFGELAKYTLWSVATGQDDAMTDALALRLAGIEAADLVFRVAHQLHGAIGFCNEAPVSWLSRYSQPFRRLPGGRSHVEAALLDRCADRPLAGPYADVSGDRALAAPVALQS